MQIRLAQKKIVAQGELGLGTPFIFDKQTAQKTSPVMRSVWLGVPQFQSGLQFTLYTEIQYSSKDPQKAGGSCAPALCTNTQGHILTIHFHAHVRKKRSAP